MTRTQKVIHCGVLLSLYIQHGITIKCDPLEHKYYHEQLAACLDCEKCLKGHEKIELTEWYYEYDHEVGPTRCRPCTPCKSGTYSDERLYSCKPCKNCTLFNQHFVKSCDQFSDSVCDGVLPSIDKRNQEDVKSLPGKSDHSETNSSMTAIIILIIVIVCLVYASYCFITKRRTRRNRTANRQMENDIELGPMEGFEENEREPQVTPASCDEEDEEEGHENKPLLDDFFKNIDDFEDTSQLPSKNSDNHSCLHLQGQHSDVGKKEKCVSFQTTPKAPLSINKEDTDPEYKKLRVKGNLRRRTISEHTLLIGKRERRRKRYMSVPCDDNDKSCAHEIEDDSTESQLIPYTKGYINVSSQAGFGGVFRKRVFQRQFSCPEANAYDNIIEEEETVASLVDCDCVASNDSKESSDEHPVCEGKEEMGITSNDELEKNLILDEQLTISQILVLSKLCTTEDQVYLDFARAFGLTETDIYQLKYDNRYEPVKELSYQIFLKIAQKRITLQGVKVILIKLEKENIWFDFCKDCDRCSIHK